MEAGDEEPLIADVPGFQSFLPGSSIDYAYTTQKQSKACEHDSCSWPRGKVMGGSSTINGMGYQRGSKFDYDNWARLGNYGWDWNNVLPYFKKSENFKAYDVS